MVFYWSFWLAVAVGGRGRDIVPVLVLLLFQRVASHSLYHDSLQELLPDSEVYIILVAFIVDINVNNLLSPNK